MSSAISRKARDRAYSVHNCLESWQVEILSPSQFFGRIACQHSCAGALQNVLTGFKVTNCARHFHHYIFLVLRATRTHSRKFARIAGNLPAPVEGHVRLRPLLLHSAGRPCRWDLCPFCCQHCAGCSRRGNRIFNGLRRLPIRTPHAITVEPKLWVLVPG